MEFVLNTFTIISLCYEQLLIENAMEKKQILKKNILFNHLLRDAQTV